MKDMAAIVFVELVVAMSMEVGRRSCVLQCHLDIFRRYRTNRRQLCVHEKDQVICRAVQGHIHERSSQEFRHNTNHRRRSSHLVVVVAVGLPSMTSTSSAAAWLPPCTPNGCRSPNSPLSSPPGSHTGPLPLQAPMVAVPQTLLVLLPVREAVRESNSTRSVKEKKRDGHPPNNSSLV